MAGGLVPSWHCQEQVPSFLSLRMEAVWEVMEFLHLFLTLLRNSFVNRSYKLIFLEIFKEGTGRGQWAYLPAAEEIGSSLYHRTIEASAK